MFWSVLCYHKIPWGNTTSRMGSGEHFTKFLHSVCRMIAQITGTDDLKARLERQGWVSVSDCCCGAGALSRLCGDRQHPDRTLSQPGQPGAYPPGQGQCVVYATLFPGRVALAAGVGKDGHISQERGPRAKRRPGTAARAGASGV